MDDSRLIKVGMTSGTRLNGRSPQRWSDDIRGLVWMQFAGGCATRLWHYGLDICVPLCGATSWKSSLDSTAHRGHEAWGRTWRRRPLQVIHALSQCSEELQIFIILECTNLATKIPSHRPTQRPPSAQTSRRYARSDDRHLDDDFTEWFASEARQDDVSTWLLTATSLRGPRDSFSSVRCVDSCRRR